MKKTKKRKLKIINKTRFFTILFIATIIVVSSSIITVNAFTDLNNKKVTQNTQKQTEYYIVKDNDTLWEISINHKNDMDIRKYLHKLQTINELDNSKIYPGMKLRLP